MTSRRIALALIAAATTAGCSSSPRELPIASTTSPESPAETPAADRSIRPVKAGISNPLKAPKGAAKSASRSLGNPRGFR